MQCLAVAAQHAAGPLLAAGMLRTKSSELATAVQPGAQLVLGHRAAALAACVEAHVFGCNRVHAEPAQE